MAKRTEATNWEVISSDDTGAMVNIDYIYPYCGMDNGELILIGATNANKIDGSWETDQICGICDKKLIVECH